MVMNPMVQSGRNHLKKQIQADIYLGEATLSATPSAKAPVRSMSKMSNKSSKSCWEEEKCPEDAWMNVTWQPLGPVLSLLNF